MKLDRLLICCVLSLTIGEISAQTAGAPTEAKIFSAFKKDPLKTWLPDFSYAGYHYGEIAIPHIVENLVDVSKHGIKTNSMLDQTEKVQKLIDSVGVHGGGVIFFPKGKYYFNMDAEHKRFLKINYSHMIIRGEGNNANGTIFYDGNQLTQTKVSAWLSPALIQTGYDLQNSDSFWGIDYEESNAQKAKVISTITGAVNANIQAAKIITEITDDAKKGSSTLKVTNSSGIHPGDVILIGMYNTTDDGNLIKDMLKPYLKFESFEQSALDAGPYRAPSYQWLVEVARIIDAHTIKLKQPLRRDISTVYKPVIAAAPMLEEIGIENISLQSAWSGFYCHHGCDPAIANQGKEMDYGWNAVNICRVKNGWLSNLTIEGFTSPIYILDSRNITVQNIVFKGYDAHSGIKVYSHACDNLIKGLVFNCSYTHILSGEGNAYGNVFMNVIYKPVSNKPGYFDFHGFSDRRFSPPAENLFENIQGMNQINGGGAANNLPHTANYNTWWNVEEHGFTDKNSEMFFDYELASPARAASHQKDHNIMYPRSILVGVYDPGSTITDRGSSTDRFDDWAYIENFNKGKVDPASLYKAQLELRMLKSK